MKGLVKKNQKSQTPLSLTSTTLLRLSLLTLAFGLAPRFAVAGVAIMDLSENQVTAVVTDSINPGDNRTYTNDMATPEKVMFSISVDGMGGQASGVAVLTNADGTGSDILQVDRSDTKFRGQFMNIPYFTISGTFTSDEDPGGLSLDFLGADIKQKVLDQAQLETGTDQNMSSHLIDIMTGEPLNIITTITAASDVPEPPSIFLFSASLLALGAFSRRRGGKSAR